ncbi:MAG: hypothetical protein HFF00_06795 [Ruminiclostridium sp.]|nr:hypothetical protein [Ruminiclostridium sp.]
MQEKLHQLKEEARYLSSPSSPVCVLLWGRRGKKSTDKVNKKAKDLHSIFVSPVSLSEFDKRGVVLRCGKSTKKEG